MAQFTFEELGHEEFYRNMPEGGYPCDGCGQRLSGPGYCDGCREKEQAKLTAWNAGT